jgi:glycosyltransferase involved in cell wall biosynthesis
VTPRVVFVSREVYPFGGGGLGAAVTASAAALADVAEVVVLTTASHEEAYRSRIATPDSELPSGVRFEFVPEPEPDEIGSYFDYFHLWSARVHQALKELWPDGGPNLVEFADFLSEGAVTVQAKRTGERLLRHATVCVRAYTTREMCDVLNGRVEHSLGGRANYDLGRYALQYADRFLWPGGDVLGMYERFHGARNLARPELLRHFVVRERAGEVRPLDPEGRTRLIYLGRLERRKGVENLLRAVTGLSRDDWALTLLGGDTNTASLGASMRQQLELMAADDPKISFHPAVSRAEMFELLARHDVAVFPSLWECWPFVAFHAYDVNRPVLATPVGGFTEMVEDGVSGWLTPDNGAKGLAETIEKILDDRDQVDELIRMGAPRAALNRLDEKEATKEKYLNLAKAGSRRTRGSRPARPLVSAVIPYYRMRDHVEETVESLVDQTYTPLEILLVNDGSFWKDDWIVAELAVRYPITVLTEVNSGLGAARNFGVAQSRGRYVFPLDADNVAEPTFVERCVDVLEANEDVAYVSSWVRYIDEETRPLPPPVEGFQPVSNRLRTMQLRNFAGDAASVIRRRVFDLGHHYSEDATSYEDWLFYRELAADGLIGHAIPERLILYRVRSASMVREIGIPYHDMLEEEMDAGLQRRRMQWTSSNA